MSPEDGLLEADGGDGTLSEAKLLLSRVRATDVHPDLYVMPIDATVDAVLRRVWVTVEGGRW